ncbi:MAG: hypothetical protein M0007_13205 [Actinomycetota bacterium]|jgi:hypothetical protein|nr:hypothetical protein [Actinomycetota bacterium]
MLGEVKAVLWRVGARRAAWILVPLWLFLAFVGAVVPTPPPWLLLYGFFTAFGLFAAAVSTVSDRRVALRAGRADPPWRGPLAFTLPVETPVAPERALAVARRAVVMAGGTDVEAVEPATILGWIGSSWTNVPSRQQYQLAVAVMAGADGGVLFICTARPRFASALLGAGRSQRLAELLQSAVVSLVDDQGDGGEGAP